MIVATQARLTLQHRDELIEGSGISPKIAELNFWSVNDPAEVDRILNRNADRRWKHWQHGPGWAVSGVDPTTGEHTWLGCQFKPDTAVQRYENGKPKFKADGSPSLQKYYSANEYPAEPLFLDTGDRNYWPSVLADVSRSIVVSEGSKKAGAGLTIGFPTISVPGVGCGQKLGQLKPRLKQFCKVGRTVVLAFDSDQLIKHQIRRELDRLGRLIAVEGAVVRVAVIPGTVKGLDDHLVEYGPDKTRELLESAIPFEQWRSQHLKDQEFPKKAQAQDQEANKLAQSYYAVEAAIGSRLKLNALSQEIELAGEPILIEELRLKLSLDYNLSIPRQDCCDIVAAIAKKNQYHPVKEYLERVADQHPDAGIDLLDQVAGDLLGAGDPLSKVYLRKWFISAVARVLSPGCKCDTALILQGGQGLGKSSFFRALMPDPGWFSDSMGDIGNKDEVLKSHLAWINEWPELETVFNRRECSQVKAFLSSSFDLVRRPYDRSTQRLKRSNVIVGTTNDDAFLRDPTGSRRFWIVSVNKRIDLAKVEQLRDRLWAAAVHAYRRGEQWWLTPEEQALSTEQNQEFTSTHPWLANISAYVEGLPWVTTNQVLDSIKPDVGQQSKADLMVIADCLRQLEWQQAGRTRIAGKVCRKWLPPNHWEVTDPTPDPTLPTLPTSDLEVGSPSNNVESSLSDQRSNLTNLDQQKIIFSPALDEPEAEEPAQPVQENDKTEGYRKLVGSVGQVGSGQPQQGFEPYQPRTNPPQQRLDHTPAEVGSPPNSAKPPVIVEILGEDSRGRFNPATRRLEVPFRVKLSNGTTAIAFNPEVGLGLAEEVF